MAHAIQLQSWMTVRGSSSSVVVTQPGDRILDLTPYRDLVVYTEVSDFSGGANYTVQTSPTMDDRFFQALFGARTPSSSGAQGIEIIPFSSAGTPLSRWVRWRIAGTGAWSLTFRIWLSVTRVGRARILLPTAGRSLETVESSLRLVSLGPSVGAGASASMRSGRR